MPAVPAAKMEWSSFRSNAVSGVPSLTRAAGFNPGTRRSCGANVTNMGVRQGRISRVAYLGHGWPGPLLVWAWDGPSAFRRQPTHDPPHPSASLTPRVPPIPLLRTRHQTLPSFAAAYTELGSRTGEDMLHSPPRPSAWQPATVRREAMSHTFKLPSAWPRVRNAELESRCMHVARAVPGSEASWPTGLSSRSSSLADAPLGVEGQGAGWGGVSVA